MVIYVPVQSGSQSSLTSAATKARETEESELDAKRRSHRNGQHRYGRTQHRNGQPRPAKRRVKERDETLSQVRKNFRPVAVVSCDSSVHFP